ncbi:hypothetical protein ABZ023_35060 [Streptomyces sp. NPDC006367]|uniref:hypothetical protein n=1 Tax=unclassified Streptomyces TaxID=2593676 RepID=UPI0033AECB9D
MTAARQETSAGCVCLNKWAELVTVIEGRQLAALPSDSLGPAAALYLAFCATCGAEYPGPWRLVPGQARAA